METHRHVWQFHLTAQEAWEAMHRDCEQATASIEMEQYIFGNDAVGKRFLELFIRKAKEGVRVFVICDRFGSLKLSGSPLIRKLRRHGGHFRFCNPITRWNILTPWRWFPRTHVKTLLVDSAVAHVGSACLEQRMTHWRDTQIRITGSAITYIRQAFDAMERSLLRHKKPALAQIPPRHDPFRYVMNQPGWKKCIIYQELAEAVGRAERYLYISTAYFIPHARFFALLEQAVRRGVEVMLLVPEHSDITLADWVFLSYSRRLLGTGVRVFHYLPQNLHCKTAVIDDRWATVGSANFDVISFFHNREANLVITDAGAVAELKQQFLLDLAHSRELTPDDWRALSLWQKAAGCFARSLKVFFRS